MARFLYQPLAEPVLIPAAPPAFTTWLESHHEDFAGRRKRLQHSVSTVIPLGIVPEAPALLPWWEADYPDTAPRHTRLQPSLSTSFVPVISASGPQPVLVQITGSLFHPATGAKITTGEIRIRPKAFLLSNAQLVAPVLSIVTVPASGDLLFSLVPSMNGVSYIVEFDPSPADTVTPLSQKSGYFINTWTVPSSGPVPISTL